jgi:signal peptidase II
LPLGELEMPELNAFTRLKRILLIGVMLLACVGCDQATKSLARVHLQDRPAISLMGDTLRLQYAENPGAFLSLGASLPQHWRRVVFTAGGVVLVATALVYASFAARLGLAQIVAAALICGGGVGNLVDRVRYDGLVTDFLNVGAGSLRTGIFNVADVALMAGMVLLFVAPGWRRTFGQGVGG